MMLRTYRLNEDEIAVINGLRLLTTLQKLAIAYAIQELSATHPLSIDLPSNVIPLPGR